MCKEIAVNLKKLKLPGIADALLAQVKEAPRYAEFSFEERLNMLVEAEPMQRQSRKVNKLIAKADYANSNACIEKLDFSAGRDLDKKLIRSLSHCNYITHYQNIIQGSSGSGKTYLACALGVAANRQGFTIFYVRYSDMCAMITL